MANRIKILILWVVDVLILTGLDQYTKYLAVQNLKGREPYVILEGVFELYYSENRGAAFGMLQGKQGFFFIIAVAVCLLAGYAMWQIAGTGNVRYFGLGLFATLVTAGAVGNMIDRVVQGYVVDFLYFKLINFPIFNVADIYVTVSAVCLALLVGFFYKEEELQIFSWRRKGAKD